MTAPTTRPDAAEGRRLLEMATPGPYRLSGDGAQVFGGAGIVADMRTQWHNDDDEEGRAKDDERSEANAEYVMWLLDHAAALLDALEQRERHAREITDANAAIKRLQNELELMRRERDERPVL